MKLDFIMKFSLKKLFITINLLRIFVNNRTKKSILIKFSLNFFVFVLILGWEIDES